MKEWVFVDWTTYINPEYKTLFKLLSNIKEQSITKINSELKTIQRKNKGEEISAITTKGNENRRTVNLYRQSVKWLRRKYKFQMFVVDDLSLTAVVLDLFSEMFTMKCTYLAFSWKNISWALYKYHNWDFFY